MTNDPKTLHENNAHIPSAEIEADIRDTEREVQALQAEMDKIKALQQSSYRFEACAKKIEDREEFIQKLKVILEYRTQHGIIA